MDIFHCLSNGCTTISVFTKAKYVKYLLAGWLLPVPFPVIANVLTKVATSTFAYDINTSCWLATHHATLYLFAIPVLTAVFVNILLFVGSVWRLSILLKMHHFLAAKKTINGVWDNVWNCRPGWESPGCLASYQILWVWTSCGICLPSVTHYRVSISFLCLVLLEEPMFS